MTGALRAAELEVLYTANTVGVDKADQKVKDSAQRIESKPIVQKVDADPREALAGMDRVEAEAKRLVSQRAVLQLDTEIDRSEKQMQRLRDKLEDLSIRADAGLDVSAETKRAEQSLARVEQKVERLQAVRASVEVDASTVKAEAELEQLGDKAAAAGGSAGAKGGSSFVQSLDGATRGAGEKVGAAVGGDIEGTLIDALTAIPIAGGVVLAGVAVGKAISGAIQDGLQQEVGFDRLAALTGIDAAAALRIGRGAGEAYANVFGDSVEANMDTARLALQFRIIDPDATTRDAQKVIEGLSGISDALDEDVRPTATAVTTLLRSGLAKSAQEAFDLLAAGARNGLNRNEDLLDTLTEYPVVLAKLGLSGEENLGLLNQGLEAGARNTDIVADALKEFQIRATDASTMSAAGFQRLGLDAEDMTARIAAGGEGARDGLQLVLEKLRETEDPVQRNAAAVELFGTKAEDLGDALFALDLSTAVAQLDGVTGSAERMFATLADNDATRMEQAQRNVEVAAQAIQGALAQAFGDPLSEFSDWVSENRGPVLEFLSGLVTGALDFGIGMAQSTGVAAEGIGMLVGGPLANLVATFAEVRGALPGGEDDAERLRELADRMRESGSMATEFGDAIDRSVVPRLQEAKDEISGYLDSAASLGYLNDASLRLADSIAGVGLAADGSTMSLEGIDAANLSATESGSALESQLRGSIAALQDELSAAEAAGEGQSSLTDRYNQATGALVGQLMQMGYTEEQARSLIDTVMQTPTDKTTRFGSNASDEQSRVQALADRVTTLPDGTIVIRADTSPAEQSLAAFRQAQTSTPMSLRAYMNRVDNAGGNLLQFMADGGIPGLTPMASLAQMVPANTWRVVGDRGDVPELFAPLDGSARSWALMLEGLRNMPGEPPWGGSEAPVTGAGPSLTVVDRGTYYSYDPHAIGRDRDERFLRALRRLPKR